MVVHQSLSLLQFMADQGLVPSPDENIKRDSVIQKLNKIVQCWIKKIAWQRMLSENVIRDASAAVLLYGSYGLGVHDSESDIDALCVVPWFATMAEDFFIVLYNMLKGRPEVSDIRCVKDAKVPLMRFEFEGIPIDFPYAQLQVISIPESVDLLNPSFLTKIDETSWRSISGVIVNVRVLQLVPNLENFRSLLRCTKFWAKRRGIYGNLFGFFGGIHLAILSAVICQRSPDACLSALVMSFFSTFASWPWSTPVVLQDGSMQSVEDVTENRCLMPIKLPCSPYQYCQSYITRSTFNRIRVEFLRGQKMTNDILKPDFNWDRLFEPYCNMYLSRYPRFLKIYLVACVKDSLGDWIGWVKSRFPSLILKLEEIRVSCDPNPTEYANTSTVDKEPAIFFYWGLNMARGVDLTSVLKEFKNNLTDDYQGMPGKIVLSIVSASELSDIDQIPTRARRRVVDYDQQRIPVYSRHLPNYVVGFMASQGDHSGFCV
ncbi:nuclear poly(A) polymerase 3 [Amaranthus tricolor]|uniref:nuclear poly(A) polymerase 3 n=1 Tax=Amaranthus tricolor TaxID=29722 RepID=UPI00258933E6|nr:nuclear poly(A) polymerase 3 [Amaranthus tricolor]